MVGEIDLEKCNFRNFKGPVTSTLDRVIRHTGVDLKSINSINLTLTRMWANAQRDGRPAEYRWLPLFNAAKNSLTPTKVPCSNAAKTRKPLKVAGVPQTPETISAASGPKFTILWEHVEEILLLNNFFSDCRYVP